MLLCLDIACYAMRDRGEMRSREQLREASVEGAVKRLRPKFMTVAPTGSFALMLLPFTENPMHRVFIPMFGVPSLGS